jgi:SnoaL-like domain
MSQPRRADIHLYAMKGNEMIETQVDTYQRYLDAWSNVTADQRIALLQQSLTAGIVFENTTQTRMGIAEIADHLAGFQSKQPGASFRLVAMLAWGTNALATWQLVGADGKEGFMGYDVLVFDETRIRSIVMFTKVPAQILK